MKLVVSTHLKNINQIGSSPENKTSLTPPPSDKFDCERDYISTSKDHPIFEVSKQPKTILTNPLHWSDAPPATCNALRAGTRSTGRISTYRPRERTLPWWPHSLGGSWAILASVKICKVGTWRHQAESSKTNKKSIVDVDFLPGKL